MGTRASPFENLGLESRIISCMSMDEWEAERETYIDELYREFLESPDTEAEFRERLYDGIVGDFTDDRLTSFYVNEPRLAKPALRALADAKTLLATNSTAAFVFAAIALEVGIKSVLLKPIIHGLVYSDDAAGLVAKLFMRTRDEGMTKILLDLLDKFGGVDPRTHQRQGSARNLWDESKDIGNKRNRTVHRAESRSLEEAEFAVAVADCVLGVLFPRVIKNLGLALKADVVVALQ